MRRHPAACYVLLLGLATALPPAGAQDGAREETGRYPCRSLIILESDDEQMRERLSAFELEQEEFPWTLRLVSELSSVALYRLSFPSPLVSAAEENNTVYADYYRPREEGTYPGAVVLHHLGGEFTAEQLLCRKLAQEGVCAMMLWMPYYGERKPREPSLRKEAFDFAGEDYEVCRQAVLDIRRAGDWLAARPEVDPEALGITGVSLGAIMGSLAAGIDRNFRRGVFIIGGGDLAELAFNESPETEEVRLELAEKGITLEELRERLRPVDPLTYAHRMDREAVLMINARQDEVVPRRCTRALWEAMGKPRIKWYEAGHYTIAFFLADIQDRTANFLRCSE